MSTPEELEKEIEDKKRELKNAKIDAYVTSDFKYVGCDPDTRKAAYAVLDKYGNLVEAWTISAKNIVHSALVHGTEPKRTVDPNSKYVISVESQQYYATDDPRKVKSLLVLGRACGISMTYLSRMYSNYEDLDLLLPRTWTKGRPKKVNQFWTISNMGMKSIDKGTYCCAEELLPKHSATEQKHLIDAIAIANHARKEHQKLMKTSAFRKGLKL